jgi:hypothetical protein
MGEGGVREDASRHINASGTFCDTNIIGVVLDFIQFLRSLRYLLLTPGANLII